jgi:hypothetical protein
MNVLEDHVPGQLKWFEEVADVPLLGIRNCAQQLKDIV